MADMTIFNHSSGDLAADRRLEFARALQARGDLDAAADLARQALQVAPGWAAGWFALGEMLMEAARAADAGQAFDRYLALDPEDAMGAALKRSLLGLDAMPERLPDAYVRSLFDQYAPRFDEALVERLQYRAPALLRAAVDDVRPARGRADAILDLGCGTGLSGAAFRDRARRLDGVDLSPAMVAEAERKDIYDAVQTGEIRAYLDTCGKQYDLVLAVDVLIYMGALGDVFAGVRRVLNDGGLFCFTVQAMEEGAGDNEGFILGADHRYAYKEGYLRGCAAGTGYRVLAMRDCVLRQDEGRDVAGFLCICGCA